MSEQKEEHVQARKGTIWDPSAQPGACGFSTQSLCTPSSSDAVLVLSRHVARAHKTCLTFWIQHLLTVYPSHASASSQAGEVVLTW